MHSFLHDATMLIDEGALYVGPERLRILLDVHDLLARAPAVQARL